MPTVRRSGRATTRSTGLLSHDVRTDGWSQPRGGTAVDAYVELGDYLLPGAVVVGNEHHYIYAHRVAQLEVSHLCYCQAWLRSILVVYVSGLLACSRRASDEHRQLQKCC